MAPSSASRKLRRFGIPLGLLALVAGCGVYLFIRGTWASPQPSDPATAADGPICEIYQPPGGHKRIRCAAVLTQPPDRVWAAVTDYAHYSDFLPYLDQIQTEPREDGCHMTGQARSAFQGDWPFAIDVRETTADGERSAFWDEEGADPVLVNRGRWTVSPHDEGTLLVLELEAEVSGYPTFFLRNVFLHRLPYVLRAVERRAAEAEGS